MWAEILKKTIGYCILYLVFLGILKYWNFSFAHVWYQLSMNYKTMKYRYLEICTFMDYWRGLSVLKLRETISLSPLWTLYFCPLTLFLRIPYHSLGQCLHLTGKIICLTILSKNCDSTAIACHNDPLSSIHSNGNPTISLRLHFVLRDVSHSQGCHLSDTFYLWVFQRVTLMLAS